MSRAVHAATYGLSKFTFVHILDEFCLHDGGFGNLTSRTDELCMNRRSIWRCALGLSTAEITYSNRLSLSKAINKT